MEAGLILTGLRSTKVMARNTALMRERVDNYRSKRIEA
jgi:hypothetical protein